jgi:Ca2+/Na+ antiporter
MKRYLGLNLQLWLIADNQVKLAVVVAAIAQHRSPMALGNVMGSTVSNILGAFSLGLICQPSQLPFDGSAKMYALLQFLVTTLFVILAYFHLLNKVTGGILIAIFAIYIISIGVAIYRGVAEAPALSDSDSESDDESDSDDEPTRDQRARSPDLETSPLLRDTNALQQSATTPSNNKRRPLPLYRHVIQLIFGLLALSLAGYLLARSAGVIADILDLSGTVFGLTIIAFATTLPEKFISVMSGSRGQGGIVVATTAGSNIFLLTLCVGVVAVAGVPVDQPDRAIWFDLLMVWLSSLGFLAVLFLRPSRLAGIALLAGYVVFLVLEFTVCRR